MPPLSIEIHFNEETESNTLKLDSVIVNKTPLVCSARSQRTLRCFVLALLFRKLGDESIVVKKGDFSASLWEAIKKRKPRNARNQWVRILIKLRRLNQIMATDGTTKIKLIADPESIHIYCNGDKTTDPVSVRDFLRRLSGMHEVATDVAAIERCAEILSNRKLTAAAVAMLAAARTIDGLSVESKMTLASSHAKHLGNLDKHDDAIDVITSTLASLGAAAPGEHFDENFHVKGQNNPGVWYLKRSLCGDSPFNSYCLAVIRCLYQLGIAFRRKKLFDQAECQFEHIQSFKNQLSNDGVGLFRMTKHQIVGVKEEKVLDRYRCKDVRDFLRKCKVQRDLVQPNTDDHEQLNELLDLACEWKTQKPRDFQRLGFSHRRLGLHYVFLRKPGDAVKRWLEAIDYFDKAVDFRNRDETREWLDMLEAI